MLVDIVGYAGFAAGLLTLMVLYMVMADNCKWRNFAVSAGFAVWMVVWFKFIGAWSDSVSVCVAVFGLASLAFCVWFWRANFKRAIVVLWGANKENL
jgi:hypothetical protein